MLTIDKVYIDGTCGSQTLAGVSHIERVSHMTQFYSTNSSSAYTQYGWAREFPYSNVCSTIEPGNFLITKNCSAKKV